MSVIDRLAAIQNEARELTIGASRRRRGPLDELILVTPSNGWTALDTDPLRYLKDRAGVVHLLGTVSHTSAPGGVHELFVLPADFAPGLPVHFGFAEWFGTQTGTSPVFSSTDYLAPDLRVQPDGTVQIEASGVVPYAQLGNFRFPL